MLVGQSFNIPNCRSASFQTFSLVLKPLNGIDFWFPVM
jgi:hypothetical protein